MMCATENMIETLFLCRTLKKHKTFFDLYAMHMIKFEIENDKLAIKLIELLNLFHSRMMT
jgi:hypothetical protein